MNIVSIGGGPAGLYFAILMKRQDPSHNIKVIERNRADDTFGFGVVFSDATLGKLGAADPETFAEVRRHFAHWDDIDIFFRGEQFRSTGHGFCGLSRQTLLDILQKRCIELGVELAFETNVDDAAAIAAIARNADLVIAADGVGSLVRSTYAESFGPHVEMRPNKFVWLGTTVPFDAFTFYFNENEHGLWRVHAYRYQDVGSTFIVECTEETWKAAGMDKASEDETAAYLETVFAEQLDGHRLIKNRSIWRNFPNIRCDRWSHDNIVLIGDAVHTAHFSIGSGTKLAMEDCIALVDALGEEPKDVRAALALYEKNWRPDVERLQETAQVSLEWFENAERYTSLPPAQFAFSLMTRSLRVGHENLRLRDPQLVDVVDRVFATHAAEALGRPAPEAAEVPRAAPFGLREVVLRNRVVAKPATHCTAVGGVVGLDYVSDARDRARAGAALVMSEPTLAGAVSADSTCASIATDAQGRAWAAVTAAIHDAGAAAGLSLAVEHPGYGVSAGGAVSTGGAVSAEASLRRTLVGAAARADEARFDLLELDLTSGLFVELAAEPAERPLLLEMAAAVRKAWPASRPLSARILATDWGEGDFSPAGAEELSRQLRECGVDMVTVTSTRAGRPTHRLVHAAFADGIRSQVGIATSVDGGIRSFDDVNSLLAAGRVDLVECALADLG